MAIFFNRRSFADRLLSLLSKDDFELLEPKLEHSAHATLPLRDADARLTSRNFQLTSYFPEKGIMLDGQADTEEGRIEVGITGREGVGRCRP